MGMFSAMWSMCDNVAECLTTNKIPNVYRDSFVIRPLLSMIINVGVAVGLSQITTPNNDILLEKGLTMLGLVSNASISIVTLTFSLTVLSVQLAAQSYSPRLLDDFIKDPVSKIVISVNLGAYAYCYTLVYFLDTNGVNVPYVAISLLSVHMALVLVTFVSFIHIFINGFRMEVILSRAADSSLKAAEAMAKAIEATGGDGNKEELPDVPRKAMKVSADESGYITHFRLDAIREIAEELDFCVRYIRQIGEYVNRGTVLAYVWDAKSVEESKDMTLGRRVILHMGLESEGSNTEHDSETKVKSPTQQVDSLLGELLKKGVMMSTKRNSDLDVTLGIQQICDIAVRALSPGVNDPQTAIQCMDVLTSVLGTLATYKLGGLRVCDKQGNIRVCASGRKISFLLAMLDPIRLYGGNDLSVCRRAIRMFGDLGIILTRVDRVDVIPTILMQLEQWMIVARKNFEDNVNELQLMESLYNHVRKSIAESDNIVIKDENSIRDLQDFETTYNTPEDEGTDGPPSVSERTLLDDFFKKVNFSGL